MNKFLIRLFLVATLFCGFLGSEAEAWAFPVKGRKDVWVTIALNMIRGKSIPLDEQRKRCLRLLHSRQKYEQAKDDTYKKRIVHYISLSTSRIDKNKKLILLNRIGDTANFKDN